MSIAPNSSHINRTGNLFGDEEALIWLQNQPDGRIDASVAELASMWGWGRTRVYRRLERWEQEGRIAKRGAQGGRWLVTAVVDRSAAPDGAMSATAGTLSALAVDRMDTEKSQELAAKLSGPLPADVRPMERRPDDRGHGGARLVPVAISATLAVIALAIAWFGIRINAWYGEMLGRTAEASLLLAGLSVAADALALVLPAVSRQLWLDRQIGAAAVAWGLWMFTAAVALLASIGFASLNIADVTAVRARTASDVERLTTRLEMLRAERLAIREPRSVAAIDAEIQIAQPGAAAVWRSTAGCTDVTMPRSGEACAPLLALRYVRGEATRRDAIDAELRDLAVEIGRLPAVNMVDPQADTAARLARWLTAGLAPITPDDVAMARIASMALLPQIGGLVMMLAMALWPGRSQGRMTVLGKFPS
jgi:predicted anti-sigma-YlaC factor YlaD